MDPDRGFGCKQPSRRPWLLRRTHVLVYVCFCYLSACSSPSAPQVSDIQTDIPDTNGFSDVHLVDIPSAADGSDGVDLRDAVVDVSDTAAADVLPTDCELPFSPLPYTPQIPLGEIDWFVQRFSGTAKPTQCLVVDDLDKDGALDLLWGELQADQPVLRVYFGPLGPQTVDTPGEVIQLVDFGQASACTVFDSDLDGDLDVVIASVDGELGELVATGKRMWDFRAKAGIFPDSLSGTRLLITLPLDLDHQPPLELLVGGSPEVLIPCTGAVSDPGGGQDVKIFAEIPEVGWLRCVARGPDGMYRVTPDGVCPEFTDGLWLGAAKGDLDGDPELDLPELDLVVVQDFGFNRKLTFPASGGLRFAQNDPFRPLYNHGMGVHIADLTQDGLLDTVITDIGPDQMYVGQVCGLPVEQGLATGLAVATDRTVSWGVTSGDFDRDGDVDVLTGVSIRLPPGGFLADKLCYPAKWGVQQANLISIQSYPGRFTPLWIPQDPRFEPTFWGAVPIVADLDDDGDVDAVIVTEDSVRILWNQIESHGAWLQVVVTDMMGLPLSDVRVVIRNEQGHGATRFVTHTTGYAGHSPLRAYFGLGTTPGPWTVVVTAPGHLSRTLHAVESRQTVVVPLTPDPFR